MENPLLYSLFILSVLSFSVFAAYPAGLVSYWSFDSNANDLVDSNAGSVSGATISSSGKVSGTYNFNGSQYIALPNTSSNLNLPVFSISVWVKPTSFSTSYPTIIRKNGAQDIGFNENYHLRASYGAGDGRVLFRVGSGVPLNQSVELASTGAIPLNQWTLITATFNGSVSSLYINGMLNNSAPVGFTPYYSETYKNYVGIYGGTGYNAYGFVGSIDELAIFNRSLSASEISDMYSSSQYGVKNYFGDCRHACASFGSGTQNDSVAAAANNVFSNITLNTVTTLSSFKFNWNGTNYSLYDSSLVAMWGFESSLSDSSSYGNTGSFVGGTASYPTGKYGKGLSFNGNSQYVNTSDFLYSNAFSVSAWVNPTEQCAAATTCGIVDKRLSPLNEWRLTLNAGKPALAGWDSSSNVIFNTQALSAVPAGSWSYVVAVLNSTNVSVYINGELSNTGAVSGLLRDTVSPIHIGTDTLDPTRFFNGTMDEVRIYNRSLSAAEVRQLYYSNLKKISSTSWEFITNQTNLTDGAYTYAGYSTDTQGYTDSTGVRSITLAYNPVASTYGGETTNFATVPDITNVTNLTLEQVGKGKIKFPSTHSVNAAGADFDTHVIIGNGFISVNSSALDSSFNSTATLTMNLTGVYSGASAPTIYYYEPFASSLATIINNGAVCAAPICTGVSWNQGTGILTFNVTGFSDYGVNGSANYSGAGGTPSNTSGTIGINITSTNQIAVYTSSSMNNSAFSFIPVTPPAAGSIVLTSNESGNVTGGDTGFLVENQGNVNVSITVASDKDAAGFIGGSSPLFQMFGGLNETGACPSLNASMQGLSGSEITVCPSLAYADSQDAIWAYVLVKIDSDSPPQTSTATLTFTSTQV
ncbi:MAG: LamG domain-containing protein [Candidatus Micrarchaeia archaeon]